VSLFSPAALSVTRMVMGPRSRGQHRHYGHRVHWRDRREWRDEHRRHRGVSLSRRRLCSCPPTVRRWAANISRLTSRTIVGRVDGHLTAANSQIKDVNVAQESTQFLPRWNILVQAGTTMLAQANASPQSVLKLLQ